MEHENTYRNPILYFDYSDPDAIRVGEDYFLVASSFCNAPGLPLLHSKDLVHWEHIQNILPRIPGERYDEPVHGCGVWAPSIRYHEGRYYVFFPMPDEGIFVTTTKDPWEEWTKPVNIRPGAGWIDPCPFWDEDGRAYLVAGVAKSRIGYKSVLHLVEMQPDGMGLIGEERVVFDGNQNGQHTIEGPKLYKRNGYYYIFAPAGGVKTGWQTVLRAKNIWGPYEYRVVLEQGDTDVNGPHQGAWVDTVMKEDWFLHFQDVYAAGRIVHLQPMKWDQDWPVMGSPVSEYPMPKVGTVEWKDVHPPVEDDFRKGIGLQWQWNANPGEDWFEVMEDGLHLFSVDNGKKPYGDCGNLLMQKWFAPEFTCLMELDLSNLKEGEEGGVISFGMNYLVLAFVKDACGYEVQVIEGSQHFGKILVEETTEKSHVVTHIENPKICVKYQVERVGTRDLNEKEKNFPLERVTLSFCEDGGTFVEAGSMEAVPGRWVGTKFGMFCRVKEEKGKKGYLLCRKVSKEENNHA